MQGPRSPAPHEMPRVIDFLDRNLRPQGEWSIAQEYPTAFHNSNLENIRIITDPQNDVLSHAVIKPIILQSPLGLCKVATIGSVVTQPENRQQGLSHAVLKDCLQRAEQAGCEMAILWTDLFDFYRKLGFELAGSEITCAIDQPLQLEPTPLRFHKGANVDPQALLKVFNQHTVHSLRSAEDFRQFLAIPNSRVYTAWNPDGALAAFAVEGKGADLTGYIHEWGGGVKALLALFQHIYNDQGRTLHVILPSHAQNLIAQLRSQGLQIFTGYLGMMKILQPHTLSHKLQRFARAIGLADFIIEWKNGELQLGRPGRLFTMQDERRITKLLFGPQPTQELLPTDDATAELLQRVLPVPLWFWGWDSL